jgi:hypothetical protein
MFIGVFVEAQVFLGDVITSLANTLYSNATAPSAPTTGPVTSPAATKTIVALGMKMYRPTGTDLMGNLVFEVINTFDATSGKLISHEEIDWEKGEKSTYDVDGKLISHEVIHK